MCIVKSVDKFGDTWIFFPPQIHGGGHGYNVSTLDTTTVRGEKVREIIQSNAGVKLVWVSEVLYPSVFDDIEDE